MKKQHLLFLLIVLIHALFFIKQCKHYVEIIDGTEYLFAAKNIIHNQVLYAGDLSSKIDTQLYTRRPIGYPLIISASFLICNHIIFLLFIQNIISIFILLLVFKLSKNKIENNNWVAFFLLIILTPSQAIYTNLVMSEIWLQFAIVMMLYFFNNFNFQLYKIINISLAIVLAMLIKPVFSLFGFFWLFFGCLHVKKLKLNILFFLLPVFCYFSVLQINKNRTGFKEFSSIVTFNLVEYNTFMAVEKKMGKKIASETIDEIENTCKNTSYALQQKCISKKSIKILQSLKSSYFSIQIRGMVAFFFDPGRYDICTFFELKKPNLGLVEICTNRGYFAALSTLFHHSFQLSLVLFFIFIINVCKFILLIKYIFTTKDDFWIKGFCIFTLAYVCVLTGPLGASRFLMPLFPIYFYGIFMVLATEQKKSQLQV